MENNLEEGNVLICPWTRAEFHQGCVKQGFIPPKCSCVEGMDWRVAVWPCLSRRWDSLTGAWTLPGIQESHTPIWRCQDPNSSSWIRGIPCPSWNFGACPPLTWSYLEQRFAIHRLQKTWFSELFRFYGHKKTHRIIEFFGLEGS